MNETLSIFFCLKCNNLILKTFQINKKETKEEIGIHRKCVLNI